MSPAAAPALRRPGGEQGRYQGGARVARSGKNLGVVAVVLFVGVVAVLLAGFGSGIANAVYVAAALVTGAVLYAHSPGGYVSFALWIWFVTPFVRRVLDMHHGWSPASPALIAPLAVAGLSALTVLRRIGQLRGSLYAPYLLVLVAVLYGYAVGLIRAGVLPATYALATWLAPAFFGLHVGINWRRYPELAASIRKTFQWALPIVAAYGVYQFVRMPQWDALWMINADLQSIGQPRPFMVRVFGSLNTPGPYAAVLCAGALLLLPSKGRFRFVSIAVAMVGLLLARTRAVWVAFLIGLVVQQIGQPLRRLPKYAITLIAVTLLALPVAFLPQFSESFMPRLRSFSRLSEDNSFIERYNFSVGAATGIVETAEGNGLGSTGGAVKLRGMQGMQSFDNGFLEIFFIFGWPGGTLLFLGVGGLMLQAVRFREARADPFANAARATSVALVSILPIGGVFIGSTGMLLWMCIGLGIAGHAYHLTTGEALRSQQLRRAIAPLPGQRQPPSFAPTAGIPAAVSRRSPV